MRKAPEFYPLSFQSIFKKKPWGGELIRKYLGKRNAPPQTGESWEIADLGSDASVVDSGAFKGETLRALIRQFPREILGSEIYFRHQRFPLLIKFLHARERLSLQVHPTDEMAQRNGDERGKTEAWYILKVGDDSRVIRGALPGTTREDFAKHLQSNTVEECVNVMKVKESDVIFLPPGTLHSAFGDVVILEVQETADVTYRLHDWNRGRKVEPDKAFAAIDLDSIGVSKIKPIPVSGFGYRRRLLLRCEKFTMEHLDLPRRKRGREKMDGTRFKSFVAVSGAGKFRWGEKMKRASPFKAGRAYLIPACLGTLEIVAEKDSRLVCASI